MGPEKPPKQRRQDVAVAGAAAGLPAAPVKRKRRWWIWVLLLLVLVLAVIGIYFGCAFVLRLTPSPELMINIRSLLQEEFNGCDRPREQLDRSCRPAELDDDEFDERADQHARYDGPAAFERFRSACRHGPFDGHE